MKINTIQQNNFHNCFFVFFFCILYVSSIKWFIININLTLSDFFFKVKHRKLTTYFLRLILFGNITIRLTLFLLLLLLFHLGNILGQLWSLSLVDCVVFFFSFWDFISPLITFIFSFFFLFNFASTLHCFPEWKN